MYKCHILMKMLKNKPVLQEGQKNPKMQMQEHLARLTTYVWSFSSNGYIFFIISHQKLLALSFFLIFLVTWCSCWPWIKEVAQGTHPFQQTSRHDLVNFSLASWGFFAKCWLCLKIQKILQFLCTLSFISPFSLIVPVNHCHFYR